MIPHPLFTLLAAFLLSIAMAMTEDRTLQERLYASVPVFSGCVLSVVGGSWLMRLIHG